MAALPRSAWAGGEPIRSSRLSTSVSTRDTKNEATETIRLRSCPFAFARSSPVMNASMTCWYRLSPKMSVTLTLMPSARVAAMAGTPSPVAGILMYALSRSTSHASWRASATVLSVA